jgi:hypothetical protein
MAAPGKGMLGVWMDIPAACEDDLNRWYNEEHLAERLGIAGFINARRYQSLSGTPKYLALYDTADAQVLQSEAYRKVAGHPSAWTQKLQPQFQNFVRNEYELLLALGTVPLEAAPYVLTVRLDIGPAHEEEFNDWYNTDHLPALANVPGVYGARRYRATVGSPRYLAVYDLANSELLQGEVWKKAAASPWTLRMRRLYTGLAANVGQRLMAMAT